MHIKVHTCTCKTGTYSKGGEISYMYSVDGGIMRFQEVILNNTCISHFDAKCTKLKLESEIISLIDLSN